MTLKNNVYLTLEEVADWLKIDYVKIGIAGDTKAQKIIQDLTFTSKLNGTDGNAIQVEYIGAGTAGVEVVTVLDKKITVKIEDGVSTASQIKSAIEALAAASALVSVAISGVGSNAQNIAALTNLTGGVFGSGYDARLSRVLTRLVNDSCDWIEREIQTSVLIKEYKGEIHDGSNSNVVKPHHWPVTELSELKIDYSRQFGASSALGQWQYFLRGGSDVRQVSGDPVIRIIGNDVVLIDDGRNFRLGSIFAGSALGSISITYKAGWAKNIDDVPSDLRLATLQLIEFFFFQRENRDISVSSKGVKGESYTKLKDGIPDQIYDMIARFEDVSLGTKPVPQRNATEV